MLQQDVRHRHPLAREGQAVEDRLGHVVVGVQDAQVDAGDAFVISVGMVGVVVPVVVVIVVVVIVVVVVVVVIVAAAVVGRRCGCRGLRCPNLQSGPTRRTAMAATKTRTG